MSRTSRCRKERQLYSKMIAIFLVFFIILLTGILLTDVNTNRIVSGEQGHSIVNVIDTGDDIYSLEILGCKIDFNLKYVKRDLSKLSESD